jgi:hypothetical protein
MGHRERSQSLSTDNDKLLSAIDALNAEVAQLRQARRDQELAIASLDNVASRLFVRIHDRNARSSSIMIAW